MMARAWPWPRRAVLVAAGAGALLAVGLQSTHPHPSDGPLTAAPATRSERVRERNLLNIALVTHEGRAVRFYDDLVRGRVVAINFMLTLCQNACPTATANIAQAQKSLAAKHGSAVRFLSITLSPEVDTPDVLRAYAEAHAAGPDWTFLTGRREDIEQLRRSLGAYELDPELDKNPTQHTGLVILGNEPEGRWKAIPALSNPIRIRQAIERILLPVTQWPTGAAVVDAVAREDSAASRDRIVVRSGQPE